MPRIVEGATPDQIAEYERSKRSTLGQSAQGPQVGKMESDNFGVSQLFLDAASPESLRGYSAFLGGMPGFQAIEQSGPMGANAILDENERRMMGISRGTEVAPQGRFDVPPVQMPDPFGGQPKGLPPVQMPDPMGGVRQGPPPVQMPDPFDVTANQAAVDQRAATTPVPTTKGTPPSYFQRTLTQAASKIHRDERTDRIQGVKDRRLLESLEGLSPDRREARLTNINRARKAIDLGPLGGASVQDKPIDVKSLADIDPQQIASGQAVRTPDGKYHIYRYNPDLEVADAIPARVDPTTLRLVPNELAIAAQQFVRDLSPPTRHALIDRVRRTNTEWGEALRALEQQRQQLGSFGSVSGEQHSAILEQLRDIDRYEAEIVLDYEQSGFAQGQDDDLSKFGEQAAKTLAKDYPDGFTDEQLAESIQQLRDNAATQQRVVEGMRGGGGDAPTSQQGITVEQERFRVVELDKLRPPTRGAKLDRKSAQAILNHVATFYPDLLTDEQQQFKAEQIARDLGWNIAR